MCYSYKILSDVCLTVKRKGMSWEYSGGCFKGGEAAHYEVASPKEIYKFDKLLI